MSDIIIFPKLKGNLMNQIHTAMTAHHYEQAYDLFNDYEKHFELTEDEHLLKLDCLYQLESFLELREESSILLNQGHYAYDKIVPYFIESLLKLKQYQTVVELIDSLRSEDVDHKIIVSLMPFYDEAHHQLNKRNAAHINFIRTFKDNDANKQLSLILELIQTEDYRFQMSFVQMLEHNMLHPMVSSMMLEYLLQSGYKGEVKFNKLSHDCRILVSELSSLVQTELMQEIMPVVIDYFEDHSPDMVQLIVETIRQHNTIIYPIRLTEVFKCSNVSLKEAYIQYFNALFHLNEVHDQKGNNTQSDTIRIIALLEKYNILNEY
ncbi:hypothetical protein [Macrococcus capreoli]|uniref:hypothetical protein n=1 Tax=Macrococcus capreoli TaxID=2982690 RepID=UPI0021D6059E|nr:hypothetical protein [Macrococcus sp. TMW 2.2395]MCU7557120.1 hypothetical protein [Macrococcus sp. TMW 2.2395]